MGVMSLLAEAQAAGLSLSTPPDGRLVIDGPAEAEELALDLLAHKQQVIAQLSVLNLARSYDWRIAVIVGGRIDRELEQLILGEVVGGDEAHWRAFADRATQDQLHEAAQLMAALEIAEPVMSADAQLEPLAGWQRFHSIPCRASPDGWADFAQLRATPNGPLLCVHCGQPHGEAS